MKQCGRCGEWAPDRARFCPECGARLASATAVEERRKVVTVVFADVVGSTALGERVDPETLRWAMQRWFERMGQAVERHGGTIEDYRGDGVMAVFGIPVTHEDDALRATRAALDMREAGSALRAELLQARGVDLLVRIGLNTGQAATGSRRDGGTFTTGDAVNVAARLEQAAPVGEILLGGDTYRLVEHAVEAEVDRAADGQGQAGRDRGLPSARGRADRAGAAAAHERADGRPRGRVVARGARPSSARAAGARASCAPSSARPGSASRGSWPSSPARSPARRRSPAAAACPTARRSRGGRSWRHSARAGC